MPNPPQNLIQITNDEVFDYAEIHRKQNDWIATIGRRTFFRIAQTHSRRTMVICLKNGNEHPVADTGITAALQIWNTTNSPNCTDYQNHTRHASYLLAIFRDIKAEKLSQKP